MRIEKTQTFFVRLIIGVMLLVLMPLSLTVAEAAGARKISRDSSPNSDRDAISVEVHPTVFYQRKSGQLVEIVDVLIKQSAPVSVRSVTLFVNKQEFTQPLSPAQGAGQEQVEFAVPAFASGTEGSVLVKLGSRWRRFPVTLKPARKWTIYVVPNEHLDVGYTDYRSKVAEIHSHVIDEVLHVFQENPQFRYSPDGFWVLHQFFAGRDAQDRHRLIQAIQAGKFFVPAQYAILLTGFPTVETLIRSLYPSFQFDQRYHEPFNYANITDVPSYTWSYASILAAAGIKYLAAGPNQGSGRIPILSHLERNSPFWWEGPDGKKVLMWYSNGYAQLTQFFGGFIRALPPSVAKGRKRLPGFLKAYSNAGYKPNAILLYGTQWENSDLYPQQATIVDSWNKIYAYPHLVYSGFVHAMAQIAKQEANSIPVFRGDGGPHWEDGIASDARYAAIERQSEQRALSAEKISTISFLASPPSRPAPGVIRNMWRNMVLFDEHTFTAGGSVSSPESKESVLQLAYKDAFATHARRDVDYVIDRGLAALADKIPDPSNTWVVFNPLNWPRTALVNTDLHKGWQIVDMVNHHTVPYEVLSVSGPVQHIRFLATNVPAVGYKCYAIKHAASPPPSVVAKVPGDVMENAYYRIVLDPETGSVKSIFDNELQKELVSASSPYRFDQYLYVTRSDEPRHNSLDPDLPRHQFTVHPAGNGRLISITKASFGLVAHLKSSAVNTPQIESEIILFNHQKKIEFINHVHKRLVYTKEGVYFAFPLAMNHPEFRYEIQNGYVNPARDQLPGAGKEWFSVQHWVEAQQGNLSVALVPIDASLVTLGDINRGLSPKKFGERKGTIFSYVMNNYWGTNYRAAQGGKFTFRYVLTSDDTFQPAALSRLGWSTMTPLEVDDITPNDKAVNTPEPLNGAEESFVHVASPDVVMVTWKRAMDRQGTVMRFVELAGKTGSVRVQIPLMNVQQSWQCNAVEQNQQAVAVSAHGFRFVVQPFQIVTVRLKGMMNLPAPPEVTTHFHP